MSQRTDHPIRNSLWLKRPRLDGGCDYVNFRTHHGAVEVREGNHLPPQMPLLKHRHHLPELEAEARKARLQQNDGYCHSEPLF